MSQTIQHIIMLFHDLIKVVRRDNILLLNRTALTLFCVTFIWTASQAQCPPISADIVVSGSSSADYTLNFGDTLHISTSANYSGNVTMQGGVLYNCASATQNMIITTIPSANISKVYNYRSIDMSGANDQYDVDLYNYGTINKTGDLIMDSEAKVHNYGTLTIGGKITTKVGGEYHNYGTLTAGADLKSEIIGGFYNYDTGIFSAEKFSLNGHFYNAGVVNCGTHYYAEGSAVTDNQGGCWNVASDFSNKGTINGLTCGTITVSGDSDNQGTITGPIAFVDASAGSPPFVDSNSGSMTGVIGTSCGCPGAVEDCADGIDNDGDGLIDCEDPDCNASLSCSDNDSDGYNDAIDLDDDNDGILDTDEHLVEVNSYQPPCNPLTLDFTGPPSLESGVDLQVGAVYKYTSVGVGIDAKVSIVQSINQSVSTLDDDATDPSNFKPGSACSLSGMGDVSYTEYFFEFVTGVGETPVVIPELFINFNDIDGNATHGEQNSVQVPTSYTYDDPTDLTTELGDWVLANSGTTEYDDATNLYPQANFSVRYINKSSLSIRTGVENRTASPLSDTRRHSLEFACVSNFLNPTTYLIDLDEDGYPNFLDLDSDNDGIYDCVESISNQAQSGGVLDGGVDSYGIPLSVSNGIGGVNYTYGDANSDSILNAYSGDSDGDGCPDVLEAGFPDADGDQQLGGLSPPNVDTNGVVTSGGL